MTNGNEPQGVPQADSDECEHDYCTCDAPVLVGTDATYTFSRPVYNKPVMVTMEWRYICSTCNREYASMSEEFEVYD